MMEAARFLAVAVAGLALDLAVAWSIARLLDLPLWIAAVIGFAVAATANYAVHELWTFREGARRLSTGRAARYGVALAATLGARVVTVAALAALVGDAHALPVLLAGAGVSFFVNYLVSKHFVFRPASASEETTP